jgi:hypothetical protein
MTFMFLKAEKAASSEAAFGESYFAYSLVKPSFILLNCPWNTHADYGNVSNVNYASRLISEVCLSVKCGDYCGVV